MLHTFQFSSGRVRYKVSGQGPLLILLHGFGGNDQDWAESTLLLQSYFTVVVPSLMGIYMPTSDKLSFRQQVEVVGGFIAEVRARFKHSDKGVYLAGTSYGGAMAWGTTILFPNLVHRLILVNAMPPHPISFFQNRGLRVLLELARVPILIPLFLQSNFGRKLLKDVEVLFQVPWVQHTKREKLARWTSRKAKVVSFALSRFSSHVHSENWNMWQGRLLHVHQPVMIISAREDALFDRGLLQKWHDKFPTKIISEMSGSHMLTREEPELIAETIVEFSQYEFVNQCAWEKPSNTPNGAQTA